MQAERKAVESGKAKLRKTADQIRNRKRASQGLATPRGKKTLVRSRDPIDDVTHELITKCAGPKAKWRTLDGMSSIAGAAKSTLNEALTHLGDAVKTRPGDGDEVEGDRDELLVRAERCAEMTKLRADNARLRAENADLRAKLADANAEIDRLRGEKRNGATGRTRSRSPNDGTTGSIHRGRSSSSGSKETALMPTN
jgi:hypothetical protein